MGIRFGGDTTRMYDATAQAQKLAFAPIFFQAVRVLRNTGVLAFLDGQEEGADEQAIAEACSLNTYAARVLLEAGVEADALIIQEETYHLSKTGYLLLHDEITRRNMDFVHDVCYRGMFHLDRAIETGTPAGLSELGNWKTIYEGLSELPPAIQESWFAFDHFYSDAAFPEVMQILFDSAVSAQTVLDVGGNTGRFAINCVAHNPAATVTVLDHPEQLKWILAHAKEKGYESKINGHGLNLLDHSHPFPKGYDAVWMSQFLDCFPPNDIVELLKRGRDALSAHGSLYIMEPYIDRQTHAQARYSLVGTSLYFTALANGTSRMYHAKEMLEYIEEAGLVVTQEWNGLGQFQTLFRCGIA